MNTNLTLIKHQNFLNNLNMRMDYVVEKYKHELNENILQFVVDNNNRFNVSEKLLLQYQVDAMSI